MVYCVRYTGKSISLCMFAAPRETLSVDMMGEVPLSMDQYKCLYSNNRIPCEKVDELRRTPPHLSLHAIVAHNGHVSLCMHVVCRYVFMQV